MEDVDSVFRTPDFISPNTRRRRGIVLTSTNTPTTNLAENDDAAERRQRRLSKSTTASLQSPASTPRSVSRLDSERNQSTGTNGLTNTQLKDLYSNCIKLSTENKINAKNAFGLHLIDYMQDLIKTVASCTLDASAKIYAGQDENIAGENTEEEPQQGSQRAKKATHHRTGNTIETNLKNLNVNQFDLAFEVDPLFHKTSAAFDEGGTGGLLLNHLFVRDDSCELLLDSSTVTMTTRDALSQGQTTQDSNMIDLSELRDIYNHVNFEGLRICPHFADFEFTNWTRNGEANTNYSKMVAELENNEHAFDVNAPATEVELDTDIPDAAVDDFGEDDLPDMGEDGRTTISSAATTTGTLYLELSSQPSDYSYFKSDIMSTWAGPQHWKLRSRFSKAIMNSASTAEQQNKKKRTKKQPFSLKFDSEVDFANSFAKGRAATTLSKTTLAKYTVDKTTLPEDLHFDADKLFRLFIKPKIMVKRQAQAQTELGDDGSAWYNYDNANDCANFCPDLQDEGDGDGGFDGNEEEAAAPGGDFTQAGFPLSQDTTLGDSSQGFSFTNESGADQTMFAGDGLVAQPNKVQKIDIAYAKTAKKMDVKRLKTAMWTILTQNPQEDKENAPPDPDNGEKDESRVKQSQSFKGLYSQLPGKLSKNMSKNLSVSIAFVCILHLANEKCLKMTGDANMCDFFISQDT
ncbi:Condensin complex subunit 2 [Acropora cervicornis]|uniref:Condensin complex subunit 2 n=1 Tax=Acropora cervicornis TaxID=6130 RepID=A0AAD9VFA4_ACRCE|nr:Condensin complex subunit 2 [Acropora cervicornis]